MDQDYKKILAPKRRRESSRGPLGILQESESDRARVLYSAAFRRLQRKTQVFPLEENAAVRSRMTHSLEVAHVGRYIATRVIEEIGKKDLRGEFGLDDECALAFANVVDTACLLHDLGNPPFGHFGEAAISTWFKKFFAKRFEMEPAQHHSEKSQDLAAFDGNPQGFRIFSRLAGVDDFGMNLTAAQMAATVKYPCTPAERTDSTPIRKKAGIYLSEGDVWRWVGDSLGLGAGKRFPLAYLMEAADDISYCLSDIEDGIEKGYVTHEQFYGAVRNELEDRGLRIGFFEKVSDGAERNRDKVEKTVFLRTQLIRELVNMAANAYVAKHNEIFEGNVESLLDMSSEPYQLLDVIRCCVSKLLYGRRPSVELELAGHTAIEGILKRFESLLILSAEDFEKIAANGKISKALAAEQRLFSLLPPKYVAAYHASAGKAAGGHDEWLARSALIVDFVAGMTDIFALKTYQMLIGVR